MLDSECAGSATAPHQARRDKPQTLYQTEYKEDIFGPLPVLEDGDAPVTVNVKGVSVRIWVEKGLLIALARSGGPDPIAAPE